MNGQQRLLIAVLITAVAALTPWRPVAAVAALATLVQAWSLAGIEPQSLLRSRLVVGPWPRWLLVTMALLALLVFLQLSGLPQPLGRDFQVFLEQRQTLISDLAQISLAVLALVVTLRQFSVERVIIKELNLITQAQLVDNFIQGISEMVSDGDGFLEDWPLERMLAEGRLAALIGAADPAARARVLRFLSNAQLLTPLRRDQRVGRPMLDGEGLYLHDRVHGVPVVMLRQVLVGVDLAGTDLSGVDFNGADLTRADLRGALLCGANLAAANLSGAMLDGADLEGVRLFSGEAATATPARQGQAFDPETGEGSGAILSRTSLAGVRNLDPAARAYVHRWQSGDFKA